MKNRTPLALLTATVLGLSSCGNNSNSTSSNADSTNVGAAENAGVVGQMTNNQTAEKLHFFFHLNPVGETDSTIHYEAVSLFETDTVGFNVEVAKQIKAGIDSDGAPDEEHGFTEGKIRITSMGTPSDNFVKSLGSLFGLETTGKMTDQTITPLIFSSNKTDVDLAETGTYSFKYFFENNVGAEAELFGVIDTYKRALEWSEKDSVYREAIISAFQAE